MKKFFNNPRIKPSFKTTSQITLIYVTVGLMWILMSDITVHFLSLSSAGRWMLDTILDCIFILISSVLLFILVRRGINSVNVEREKSEHHERLYKLISDFAEDVIWEFDPSSLKFIYVSPSVEKLLGYTPEEIYTFPLEKFIPMEYIDAVDNYISQLFNLKENKNKAYNTELYECELIRKDSTRVSTETTIYFEKDNVEKNTLIGVVRNITERKTGEKKLRESEEKYRTVVTSLHEGIIMISSEGAVLTVNRSAEIILDTPAEKIRDWKSIKNWWTIIHEDGTPFSRDSYPSETTLKTGSPQIDVIMGIQKPGKSLKWIKVNTQPLYMHNQKQPYAVVVSFADITERQNAELALKESETKYRELFENNLAGVFRTSMKGEVLDGNLAFAQLFGFNKREEVLHKLAGDFYPSKENREKYLELISIDGSLKNFEYLRKKVDGSPLWTLENVRMFKDPGGTPTHLEGTIIDITALKEAEREVIKERNQAQLYFEVAGVMFAHLDVAGNITLINKKGLEILEYSSEEIANKNWFDMVIREENREEIRKIFMKFVSCETTQPEYYENNVVCKSGRAKLLAFHNVAIKDENSRIIGVLFSGEDITERKRTEEELNEYREGLEELIKLRTEELDKANQQLKEKIQKQTEYEMILQNALNKEKELNELKTRIISITSHEFKTPLTSVLSSAELIKMYGKKWDNEKLDEHINRIKISVTYLSKLLDDVLTISRSETGKITFNPEYIDLQKLCSELIKESSFNLNTKHKLIFNYNLERQKIKADPDLLRFILLNLISNAIKYSPEGGTIELSVTNSSDNIEFEIRDEGIGISTEDEKYIFEPFHRGKNCSKIKGTGLGLTIVKHSVDLHKGEISFRANKNKGTTFTVKIPARV